MYKFLLLLFLFPFPVFAEGTTVEVGMSYASTIEIIKKHEGVDITSQMATIDSEGVYWNFDYYKFVIALDYSNGQINKITYWTEKDFDSNKSYRERSGSDIRGIQFNTNPQQALIKKYTDR